MYVVWTYLFVEYPRLSFNYKRILVKCNQLAELSTSDLGLRSGRATRGGDSLCPPHYIVNETTLIVNFRQPRDYSRRRQPLSAIHSVIRLLLSIYIYLNAHTIYECTHYILSISVTIYTQCLSIRDWLPKFSDCSCDWQMDKTQAESRAGSNISPAAHDRCSDDEGSESGDLSGTSSEKQRPLDTRAQLREATQEEASKALHDFSWIDLTEPDPKYNGAAMPNKRLAPIWKDEQGNEMASLFGRGCLKKIKRSELPMGTRVIFSRFHYKIKRHSAGEHKLRVKRLKMWSIRS